MYRSPGLLGGQAGCETAGDPTLSPVVDGYFKLQTVVFIDPNVPYKIDHITIFYACHDMKGGEALL